MSGVPVDLLFLWHHHQPDYRHPRDGRALLPWVRLHATKDYLDMARRLERHPGVRAVFNFVPALLDQLEAAAADAPDALFDLLRRPVADLAPEQRAEVAGRCATAPRWALERWPRYRALCRRAREGRPALSHGELAALEAGFLLAWTDPLFHGEPEAQRALAAPGGAGVEARDALLSLHRRLLEQVIPAYRALAERGQIELSASPYDHPILPLLVDQEVARRARPQLPLPAEGFAAPEDAARQIERALERHARAFGARPLGLWPSEGGVSPEAVAIAARAGVRWLASDESVLWHSLPPERRVRSALYRPWRFASDGGEVTLLFRDRELSDRIGFVYSRWEAADAVTDLLERVRRIGREQAGEIPPLVSVILDGENCWEHYPDDGGPFLEALYQALESASDVRTRTPSELLASSSRWPLLPRLHSGSWIDADFHIWIGHPEKNRAWDLLSRGRRALVGSGATPATHPAAFDSLDAAEGSDWFWWYGDDHPSADRAVFDRIFRAHLASVYERAGLAAPADLRIPVLRAVAPAERCEPVGLIHPLLDGRPTQFYEWHLAGRCRVAGAGGAMHRGPASVQELHYGFDLESLYLRLDFSARERPGPTVDLVIEVLAPRPMRLRVCGLDRGERRVEWGGEERSGPVAGAACQVQSILELQLPFASLGLVAGEDVELVLVLRRGAEAIESLPPDDAIRFTVPDLTFEAAHWSV